MSFSNSTRCRNASCACRRSVASMAVATRSAMEVAKFSSSTSHVRAGPVCSKQTTPTVWPKRRIGTSSIDVTPNGIR